MTAVITVYQPYASLIMAGVKRWETRGNPPNGDMRPDGVRGLPGLKIDAGERIGVHAAKRDTDYDRSIPNAAWGALGDLIGGNAPMRGYLLGTVEVSDCVEIDPAIDRLRWIDVHRGELKLSADIGPAEGNDWLSEVDISDQLPFGHWVPGGWAWQLADPIPTTEQCPACKGRPKQPSTRIEGASRSCQHCNSTRTFNFLDRPGTICRCEGARREACPVCLGDGSCDPVPVKGKQGVWKWTA